MRFRKPSETPQDLFSQIQHSQRLAELSTPLDKLAEVIDFELFRKTLMSAMGYVKKKDLGGNTPFDPVFMFKIVILQKYYNLSEEQTEFQIMDRFSFMRFLGLFPNDKIPDKNTIWLFKEKLGADGVIELFNQLDSLLLDSGIIGKEGVSVDASFVDVPKQRNTRAENKSIKNGKLPEGWENHSAQKLRQKDLDARWTKKNSEVHYGYKNHSKMDNHTKLLRRWLVSPASEHDSQCFMEILDDSDGVVYADSAYRSEETMKQLRKRKLKARINQKGTKVKSLTKSQKYSNKQKSKIRCRVEHVFGDQAHIGADKIRSIGILRACRGIGLGNLVYNLRRLSQLGLQVS